MNLQCPSEIISSSSCRRKSRQHVSNKSKLVSLSPFLDEHGIVRARGGIDRADIPFCSRHPIVLSTDHEFTCVIIMNCHERLNHEGVDHVRKELLQQDWILCCRATVYSAKDSSSVFLLPKVKRFLSHMTVYELRQYSLKLA